MAAIKAGTRLFKKLQFLQAMYKLFKHFEI